MFSTCCLSVGSNESGRRSEERAYHLLQPLGKCKARAFQGGLVGPGAIKPLFPHLKRLLAYVIIASAAELTQAQGST